MFPLQNLRAGIGLLTLRGPSRFLNRLRSPAAPGQVLRVERGIAAARAILALSSLVAISIDPTSPSRYAGLVYTLLIIFVAYSLVILALPPVPDKYSTWFFWFVKGVDILWCVSITLIT